MMRVSSLHVPILLLSSIHVSAFIVSRPCVTQVASGHLVKSWAIRAPSSVVRENRDTSLHVSGFDFLVETIIPSTLFIAAFIVALQRLSGVESSTPEMYNWESHKLPWSDIMSSHPFSTASATEDIAVSEPAPELVIVDPVNPQEAPAVASDKVMEHSGTVGERASASVAVPSVKSSARREDLSKIKKNVASTLSGQREKIERLKATEPKEEIVRPTLETKAALEVTETSLTSTDTPIPALIQPRVLGRKRKFLVKIVKKILMPWKKWSAL